MSGRRAKGGGEGHDHDVMGEAVTNVHGDDQGRPALGVGWMPWELDEVDLAAAGIRQGGYVSQRRLAERAAIWDQWRSALRSAVESAR